MSARVKRLVAWLVLAAGLIGGYLLSAQLLHQSLQQTRVLGLEHSMPQRQGMLRLVYDNPFLVGRAKASLEPPPDHHRGWTPREKMRPYPFAWRWLGMLEAPADGEYLLGVVAPEGVRLLVDGRPVVERWVGSPPRRELALVRLEAGVHLLDLQNVQMPHRLTLALLWMPPGAQDLEVVPASRLSPLAPGFDPSSLAGPYRRVERWSFLRWILPGLWLLLWLAVLRRPVRAWRTLATHRWFMAVLGAGAAARLLWAGSVHGICGESAFFAVRARLILEGALPFNGMNTRVGPIWDYLLTLPYAVFGPSWEMLRISGAAMNLLALVLCYRVALREAGKPTALACCLVLALLPGLVMYGREPVEATSLNMLFLFAGLELLSLSRRRPWLSLAAGVIWGLACFNHPIFVMVPFTLVLSGLAVSRLRLLAWPQLWGLGLGLLAGLAPRIWDRLAHSPRDVMSFTDPDRLSHFWGFQWVFGRALDGEVIYLGYVGQLLWDTWWAIPLIFAAGLGLLGWGLWRRRDATSWMEPWLALALAIHLAMAPLGAPTAQPRYFYFCLIFAGLLIGRAFARAWQWAPPGRRGWAAAALVAFAAFCASSLGVNYFYSHLASGGVPHQWESPLLDFTSDAWMDHGELAAELAARGYPVVATGDYWHHSLHLSLNLWQGESRRFQAVPLRNASDTERAAVFYRSPEGEERMRQFLHGHQHHTYRRAELPPRLAGKYILLERVSPPVVHPPDLDYGAGKGSQAPGRPVPAGSRPRKPPPA